MHGCVMIIFAGGIHICTKGMQKFANGKFSLFTCNMKWSSNKSVGSFLNEEFDSCQITNKDGMVND